MKLLGFTTHFIHNIDSVLEEGEEGGVQASWLQGGGFTYDFSISLDYVIHYIDIMFMYW